MIKLLAFMSLLIMSSVSLANKPNKWALFSFQKVIQLADKNQLGQALVLMEQIEQSSQDFLSLDLLTLTKGRLYFQAGRLPDAVKMYSSINASSGYWFLAKEELAHTYGRMGLYDKVKSELQTLMAPTFKYLINPEVYFVASVTYLKTCDYTSIFKLGSEFKKIYKPRLEDLKKFIDNGSTPLIDNVVKLIEKAKTPVDVGNFGSLAQSLPLNAINDYAFRYKYLESFDREASRLASIEKRDIENTIKRLQLIEGEAIQRIHTLETENKHRQTLGQVKKGDDVLVFPVSSEIWVDELDSYKAEVQNCPTFTQTARAK